MGPVDGAAEGEEEVGGALAAVDVLRDEAGEGSEAGGAEGLSDGGSVGLQHAVYEIGGRGGGFEGVVGGAMAVDLGPDFVVGAGLDGEVVLFPEIDG